MMSSCQYMYVFNIIDKVMKILGESFLHTQQAVIILQWVPVRKSYAGAGSLIAAVGECEEEECCLRGLIVSSDPSPSTLPVRLRLAVERAGAMGHVSSLSLGLMVMSRYLRIGLA